jgi:SAM-dependent methyltransferase
MRSSGSRFRQADPVPERAALSDIGDLLAAWDAMSTRYLPGRAELVDALVDEMRTAGATTVVDVGCGPATLLHRLLDADPGVVAVGIDDDPFLVELARRHLSSAGDRAHVVHGALDRGWAERMATPATVDAAVAMLVLHYFPADEWPGVLTEIRGLLHPQGLLAIVEVEADDGGMATVAAPDAPTWDEWWDRARRVEDPALRDALARRDARPATSSAEHHPSLAELRELLTGCGFVDIRTLHRHGRAYVVTARRPADAAS